jgi:hypothetical protein
MGDSDLAHLVATNASKSDNAIVSRFTIDIHGVMNLTPNYLLSYWVPRADLYVIVQDRWPNLFYFEDVADKFGPDQAVLYVGENMEVCTEHVRRWSYSVSFAAPCFSPTPDKLRLDVGLATTHQNSHQEGLIRATFSNIERLRCTHIANLSDIHIMELRTFGQNSS